MAKAMFSSKLTDLNTIIDPYITTKDFLAGLGQYLDTTPEKTNKAAASTYLAAVLSKVTAATGNDGDEETAASFSFNPSALTIGADYTKKTLVGTALSVDPGASGATFTLAVPSGSKISLGKTSITFKSPDDYKDNDTGNANHAFGVTLASGATAGEKITVTATGTVNGKAVTQDLIITIGANGSGVITNGSSSSTLTLKSAPQIDPKDLPGSKFDPSTLIQTLLPKLINTFLIIIALAAFFGLIYSGFMFITAGGDTARVDVARKNIVWAITGIILALLSYGIVQLAANWSSLDFGGSSNGGNNNHNTGVLKVADDKGKDLNQIAVSDPSATNTTSMFLKLEEKPSTTTTVFVSVEGNLPLELSANQFIFTPDNWDKDQLLTIVYSGNGQLGDDALLVFEMADETVFDLPYTLPEAGGDETGDGDGLIDTNGDGIDDAKAPTIVVMTPNSTAAVTNYILSQPKIGIGISLAMLIESDPIEDAELTVKLSTSGDFSLKVEPASVVFNGRNWARGHDFNVSYNGEGKSGQSAKINFSIGDEVVHSVQFSIP